MFEDFTPPTTPIATTKSFHSTTSINSTRQLYSNNDGESEPDIVTAKYAALFKRLEEEFKDSINEDEMQLEMQIFGAMKSTGVKLMELKDIYKTIDQKVGIMEAFLKKYGLNESEISEFKEHALSVNPILSNNLDFHDKVSKITQNKTLDTDASNGEKQIEDNAHESLKSIAKTVSTHVRGDEESGPNVPRLTRQHHWKYSNDSDYVVDSRYISELGKLSNDSALVSPIIRKIKVTKSRFTDNQHGKTLKGNKLREGKSRHNGEKKKGSEENDLVNSENGMKMLDKPYIINIPVRLAL